MKNYKGNTTQVNKWNFATLFWTLFIVFYLCHNASIGTITLIFIIVTFLHFIIILSSKSASCKYIVQSCPLKKKKHDKDFWQFLFAIVSLVPRSVPDT